MKVDSLTKRWVRNASDELAAANGCRFDEGRGQFVIDWMAKYLRLYEGEQAGEPLICRDWQIEATMRMFGWVKWSDRWVREIRRFTKASFWVSKKNKKSPSLAAWGTYLLCADGEPGQKIFVMAKDGGQARQNVGKHAIEMVLASPELMAECTINKSLMQITHEQSRSIMLPMSSSDARSQKAKEGINGSVLVDETHVVDRALMSRVSRTGISRSEPLQIEVSTSGDDPQSYGRSQYDYGKAVESGEREDERFLFMTYEAPQTLTDTELAIDPIKYGKMANPAWGHTVGEEEFLDDYNRSRASLEDFADFKKYRLNIWQQASNPAIRQEDWAACEELFEAAELEGRDCYGALDLGFTHDACAVALVFPWDEVEGEQIYRLLLKLWIPEEIADKERKQVQWHDWKAADEIEFFEGGTSDFAIIRREIVALSKQFRLRKLVYDERFAQILAQQLQDEDRIPIESFPQNAPTYNEPCRNFEKLVIEGRLKHQGNRAMAWMTGQLTFKDVNGLKIPAKPKTNPLARIDGPVASIMALGLAMSQPVKRSVYETRGVLQV